MRYYREQNGSRWVIGMTREFLIQLYSVIIVGDDSATLGGILLSRTCYSGIATELGPVALIF